MSTNQFSEQRPANQNSPSLVDIISVSRGHEKRCIRFFHGDMTRTEENYDILCCSAFKGDYLPVRRSLIGALQDGLGISIRNLAEQPELNMKDLGGWLSRPVNGPFRRILCVEITDLEERFLGRQSSADTISTLKSVFLTLRNLLERADQQGSEIQRIALPILGAGCQNIDIEYTTPPLFTQCMNMFQTIPSLESIDFYDLDDWKIRRLIHLCKGLSDESAGIAPSVFISYSSVQADLAHSIRNVILGKGIHPWMAPESIPTGSNYLAEISRAISSIRVLLLLLTEESQKSRWVQKEVGSAIGSGKLILPYQINPFPLLPEIQFLLEGEQIHPLWQTACSEQIPTIVKEVESKLGC